MFHLKQKIMTYKEADDLWNLLKKLFPNSKLHIKHIDDDTCINSYKLTIYDLNIEKE